MLNALKKLFGIKAQEKAKPAPYKVETPVVEQFPFPETKKPTVKKATTRQPKVEGEKKPAVKAKTARKPKTPKA